MEKVHIKLINMGKALKVKSYPSLEMLAYFSSTAALRSHSRTLKLSEISCLAEKHSCSLKLGKIQNQDDVYERQETRKGRLVFFFFFPFTSTASHNLGKRKN